MIRSRIMIFTLQERGHQRVWPKDDRFKTLLLLEKSTNSQAPGFEAKQQQWKQADGELHHLSGQGIPMRWLRISDLSGLGFRVFR